MTQGLSTALPSAWVERIFERMLTLYGKRFADMWGWVNPDSLKTAWAVELADLAPQEIAQGLERCKALEWPPSLPEFRGLCRQVVSYETAFHEAQRWPIREGWTEPAIWWAAAEFGNDIHRLPYSSIKARWVDALDRARADPRPIPPKPERALPSPESFGDENEQKRRLQEAAEKVLSIWRAKREAA